MPGAAPADYVPLWRLSVAVARRGLAMKPRYYLLIVRGDVEPRLVGPFNADFTRDEYARKYRKNRDHDAEDGLFPLDMDANGDLIVDAYSGAFFKR
jgi:hypothetical protein